MASCIIPSKLEEYRQAIKDRKLDIPTLIKMPDSASRVEAFRQFAGKDAEKLNQLFEEKLVLKNKIQGLKNFINKTAELKQYSALGKEKIANELSEYRAMQQERILNPKEDETYLNSLADKIVGTHISKEVAQKVFDLSANVDKAREENPTSLGVSNEYFKAKDALDQYVEAQKPVDAKSSVLKNLAIIGRNNLILGISTPIKTSTAQFVNSAMDLFTRRMATGELQGSNPELKSDINKEVWKTFQETGRNGLGMESLDDAHLLGYGKKGENFASVQKTKGLIAKTAEVTQHIAITLEHQIPFVKFYQKSWLDMADLMSTQLAKMEGKIGDEAKTRAGEIFKDAVRIEPQTDEGIALRKEAQKQAARVTSTNENFLANLSLGIKKMLNNRIPMGDGKFFPLGDFIEPMAKIPATVISNSIENAGAGIPFGLRDLWQGKTKIQSEDLTIRLEGLSQYASGIQRLARIGTTLGIAALMVNSIDKKDLREDKWGNRFLRIGNTWVNTEYLSFASAAMGGMIEMKTGHAKTGLGVAGEYVSGASKGLKALPGIEEIPKIIDSLSSGKMVQGVKAYLGNFLTSRGIPQALRAIFKHASTMPWFGPNTRPVDRLFFGAHGIESTQDVSQDKKEQKKLAKERKIEARKE